MVKLRWIKQDRKGTRKLCTRLLERADHTSQHIPVVVAIIDGGTKFVDAIFHGIIIVLIGYV